MGSSWRSSCAGWWSDLSDPYLQGEALVTQASHLPRPPCSAAALKRISASRLSPSWVVGQDFPLEEPGWNCQTD